MFPLGRGIVIQEQLINFVRYILYIPLVVIIHLLPFKSTITNVELDGLQCFRLLIGELYEKAYRHSFKQHIK